MIEDGEDMQIDKDTSNKAMREQMKDQEQFEKAEDISNAF